MNLKYAQCLVGLTLVYSVIFLFSAFEPFSRAVWIAEVIPALLILAAIFLVSRHYQFSTTAYLLMFIWLSLHTIGAKYTFAEVPFDWFNQMIGSDRNNFDRVAHFSIGLYAYPIAEYLHRVKKVNTGMALSYALFSIMALAAGYEIIEWWYAELAGGDEGIAFLGSQGDIWDAQKDMLMDTLGALTALTLFSVQQRVFSSIQAK
ncbi:membrane protein [Vibrio tubiashii]|nr:membrane protein [Vibrio tubiashii]